MRCYTNESRAGKLPAKSRNPRKQQYLLEQIFHLHKQRTLQKSALVQSSQRYCDCHNSRCVQSEPFRWVQFQCCLQGLPLAKSSDFAFRMLFSLQGFPKSPLSFHLQSAQTTNTFSALQNIFSYFSPFVEFSTYFISLSYYTKYVKSNRTYEEESKWSEKSLK